MKQGSDIYCQIQTYLFQLAGWTSMKISPTFRAHFRAEELDEFDQEESVIYGLDGELRLSLLNDDWYRTARSAPGGEALLQKFDLGSSYVDALAEPLREFFTSHLEQSIASGKTWAFDYLCPTPSLRRVFRMQVLPIAGRAGCVITNACVVEEPAPTGKTPPTDLQDTYRDNNGLITQCSHCRRVRRPARAGCWDWLPSMVAHMPPRVSHGICPSCYVYFYETDRP
ncbi:MAG: hypothetical protein ACOCV2_10805 [Persicimonas sp.]